MKLIFLIALKNLISKPSRTIASIVAIGMGIATVIAVFTLDHNTLLSQKIHAGRYYGRPDVEITPLSVLGSDYRKIFQELRSLSHLSSVTPVFYHHLDITVGGRSFEIKVCGIQPGSNQEFRAYSVSNGSDLSEGKNILLNKWLAGKYSIKVGDRITLENLAKPAKTHTGCPQEEKEEQKIFPVSRAVFRVSGLVDYGRIAGQNQGRMGIVPFFQGAALFQGERLPVKFWGKFSRDGSLDSISRKLKGRYLVSLPRYEKIGQSAQEKIFRSGIRIVGFLSLGLGLFVVFSTLSMTLLEKVRQIGLLKSIGTTDVQLSGIFILEALLIGILGCVLGVVLGLVLARVLIAFKITTLGRGKVIWFHSIPIQEILAVLAASLVFDVLGAVYPLIKARKLSAVRAVQPRSMDLHPELTSGFTWFVLLLFLLSIPLVYFYFLPVFRIDKQIRLILMSLLMIILSAGFTMFIPRVVRFFTKPILMPLKRFLKLEVTMATRSILEAPSRIGFSICGMMLVAASFLTFKTMVLGLKQETRDWAEQAGLTKKVFVYSKIPLDQDKLNRFLNFSTVRGIIPHSLNTLMPFKLVGINPETVKREGGISGRDLQTFREGKGIIVTRELAKRQKKKVGDSLELNTREGKVKFSILRINEGIGFFPYDKSTAVVSEEVMERLFCLTARGETRFTVLLKKASQWRRFKREYNYKYPSWYFDRHWNRLIRTFFGWEVLRVYLKTISKDFLLFDIIMNLVVVLIVVGMVNSLLIGSFERKREIGLLKVVGMTFNQISTTLLLEGIVIGILAGALGILLGIPFCYVVIGALKPISGMDLRVVISGYYLGLVFFGSIILSILAGIYPALVSSRFSVIEAIQYE